MSNIFIPDQFTAASKSALGSIREMEREFIAAVAMIEQLQRENEELKIKLHDQTEV
jgi:hypothetical protein